MLTAELRDECKRVFSELKRIDVADMVGRVNSASKSYAELKSDVRGVFSELERDGLIRRTKDAGSFIGRYKALGKSEEYIKDFIPYELI